LVLNDLILCLIGILTGLKLFTMINSYKHAICLRFNGLMVFTHTENILYLEQKLNPLSHYAFSISIFL